MESKANVILERNICLRFLHVACRPRWLVCFLAGLSVWVASACNFSVTVSERYMLSLRDPERGDRDVARLSQEPDALWFDLQQMMMDASRDRSVDATKLFSRRALLMALGQPRLAAPESNWDAYDSQVRDWQLLLDARELEARSIVDDVLDRLRNMCAEGQATVRDIRYDRARLYIDNNGYPRGPNRSALLVQLWPGKAGVGEAVQLEIGLVQEYREWRIASIFPGVFLPGSGEQSPSPDIDINASESQS